jgi:hypothetical protein
MAEGMPRPLSMLTILLATCETTLHTLHAGGNPVDEELTGLLEKVVERTRLEIETLRASA